MNIWSGQKEAKINVPDEKTDPALQGLPVDQAVLVVDPQLEDSANIPKGAPTYDPIGKVKGPQHETQTFLDAMRMLKSGIITSDNAFDQSLEALEDIAHDMYYGLKIAEDTEVVKALFCLMEKQGYQGSNGSVPRDQQAALTLAASLQNNPAALKEVAKSWDSIMATTCPATDIPLSDQFYSQFVPLVSSVSGPWHKAARPLKAKAKVSAIRGLLKDPVIRRHFLDHEGMDRLHEVLLYGSHITHESESDHDLKDWTAARRAVGLLVLDTFLDEDMGATLGEWPTRPAASTRDCLPLGDVRRDCWSSDLVHLKKVDYDWAKPLANALAKALKRLESGRDKEL